ncbi:hypothetical protein PISMIDRAFT_680761 [Pisolithus microcarpus 441]|uniref:Uncharacterized protein n=1 Tax=Pisolithus microcarpus 441 TaxID=765257 RepID=A0A0C9ZQN6_9AGAM|nr:hypothetical protein PISMIDRAFT_680761 [Pisolithus microcarpus 441]
MPSMMVSVSTLSIDSVLGKIFTKTDLPSCGVSSSSKLSKSDRVAEIKDKLLLAC